ncbi:hypothetical protein V8G54_018868 [Vigna mungo]|uniref:Uncharacterized protein n=1 Tax=Vigna mungo TaxID=3915 RepID=A0AAQ3RT36_VIGMU
MFKSKSFCSVEDANSAIFNNFVPTATLLFDFRSDPLKRVKAISHGLKKLSLWLFKLHDVSNSSSQSTTVAVAPSTTASFVEFLATEFRRREPSVILEPFQRISTTNLEPSRAASGSRSQPWRLRTINLTMNFLETGGGHGHHFFILTTIGLFPFSHCCIILWCPKI